MYYLANEGFISHLKMRDECKKYKSYGIIVKHINSNWVKHLTLKF